MIFALLASIFKQCEHNSIIELLMRKIVGVAHPYISDFKNIPKSRIGVIAI